MDKNPSPYKLRLKTENKKWLLQATTGLVESSFSCSDTLLISVKSKTVEEFFVPSTDQQIISSSIENQLESLHARDEGNTIKAIKRLDSQIQSKRFPAIDKLKSVAGNQQFVFVGTFISQKIKSKYKFFTAKGDLILSVTQGEDFLGPIPFQNRFEFEIQADETVPLESFKKEACRIIASFNLGPEDQTPLRLDPEAITLRNLKELSSGPASW